MLVLLKIVFVKFLDETVLVPSVMLHCFFLCNRLQFSSDLSILMHSPWRLVVTVMAEPYYKTESLRLITECASEDMMPFKPLPGMADKAP
jgi:hypothetical protein